MALELTFRTQRVFRLSDSHLIVSQVAAVAGSELGESGAFAAIERCFRVINRQRQRLEEVIFAEIGDGVADCLCVKRRDDGRILIREDDAIDEKWRDFVSVFST